MSQQTDHTWHVDAACREMDTDMFFIESVRGLKRRAQEVAAKAVCDSCPVVQTCLRDALEANERYGIYGGKTTAERDRLGWAAARGA